MESRTLFFWNITKLDGFVSQFVCWNQITWIYDPNSLTHYLSPGDGTDDIMVIEVEMYYWTEN